MLAYPSCAVQYQMGLMAGADCLYDRPPEPVHSTQIAILDRPSRGSRQG